MTEETEAERRERELFVGKLGAMAPEIQRFIDDDRESDREVFGDDPYVMPTFLILGNAAIWVEKMFRILS